MSKLKKSQKNLLSHSEAKVKLLELYLEKYLGILTNTSFVEKIMIFDLFCSEGRYNNGGEGSPLVILRKIRELHKSNVAKKKYIIPIDVVLNDIDSNKIAKVKNLVTTGNLYSPKYGSLAFREKNYKDLLPDIIKYIGEDSFKKKKAFVFIDPYGYKEVNAKEIKDLLATKRSEVLLFLPTQFMYRFNKKGTPEALKNFIDEIIDIKTWKPSSSVWKFIDDLKQGFRNYLGKEYYVDTFTIKKDANTVFCLFFFSSHIRGFEKMLESKWELDKDEGKGWQYEKSGNLFKSEIAKEFEGKLIMYIRKRKRSNRDVYKFSLENGYLPKHAVEVLRRLKNENKLFVFDGKNIKLQSSSFYLNYSNFKTKTDKVFFKI